MVHEVVLGLTAELDVTLFELLSPVPLSGELTGNDDVASAGSGVHDPADRGVSCSAEVPSPLKGECQFLSHDLCVEACVLDFLNLDLGVLESEALLDDGGQILDGLTAPSDNESGPLGREDDTGSHGGPLDVESSESRTAYLFHEVLLEEDPADVLGNEFSL